MAAPAGMNGGDFTKSLPMHTLYNTVPANFVATFTANVFYYMTDTSVADMSTVINYTVVANNAQFNGFVNSIIMSVVGTDLSEARFELSDQTSSREYVFGLDTELQTDGITTVLSDRIIVRNNPTTVLGPDIYDINIGALVVGTQPNGELLLRQENAVGLIEVLQSTSECHHGNTDMHVQQRVE